MRHVFLTAALLAWPLCAAAADAPGRYQIAPVEGGIARLDTQTGVIVMCRNEDGELFCDDAHGGGEDALTRLQERVEALEQRIDALKNGKNQLSGPPPGTAEIDRAFSIMETMMRRLKGLAEEWSREEQKPEPYPNRT